MTIAHMAFHSRTNTNRLTYADLRDLSKSLGGVIGIGVAIMARVVWKAADAFWAWYMYRRNVAALAGLDDHILRDIGLNRGEIHAAARFRKRSTTADYRFSRIHTR